MLDYLIYLIFILSVAMAAGGVVLSSKLRTRFHHDIFSTLMYFQVFIYAFGFYGIWGQVVIRAFLSAYISPELISRFSHLAILMGMPFLVFAWLMLLQFSMMISGRKYNKWFVSGFLAVNFCLITIVGYLIAKTSKIDPFTLIKSYFIVMNFLYSLVSSFLILFTRSSKSLIHDYDRKIIAPALIIIILVQCIPLIFYSTNPYIAILFIFSFFAGNTFLPA